MKRFKRTFLGVLDFFEGMTLKVFVDLWFKLLERAGLAGLLFVFGYKFNIKIFLIFGAVSVALLFVSLRGLFNEVTDVFLKDINRVNKRNVEVYHLKKYSVTEYTTVALVIVFLIGILAIFAVVFSVLSILNK